MSEFVKKGNKYFRNNSDGTQTQVTPTEDGHFTWVQPDGQKVRSQKRYKITPSTSKSSTFSLIPQWFVNATMSAANADTPAVTTASGWYIDNNRNWQQNSENIHRKLESLKSRVANWALSRSSGTNNVHDAALSIVGNTILPGYDTRYYTGRRYTPMQYSDSEYSDKYGTTELETLINSQEKNYIRASTIGDFTGFKKSSTKGRYQDIPEYRNLPAVIDRFYTDTLYVPTPAKPVFDRNIGKSYRLSADSILVNVNWPYVNDTYDARNHYITFNINNQRQPYAFMEDVFNTNNTIVDKQLITPIIVNQKVPVQFTDDQEKLNRIPWLSSWFLNPRDVESKTQDEFYR